MGLGIYATLVVAIVTFFRLTNAFWIQIGSAIGPSGSDARFFYITILALFTFLVPAFMAVWLAQRLCRTKDATYL